MKKSRLIILVTLLVVIVTAITFAWWRLTSFRDITFDVRRQPLTVKIVNKNKQTVATITNSSKLYLQDGEYSAYPSNADVDESAITFTTNSKNTKVTINPSISLGTLQKNLELERDDIQAAIITKYPQLIGQFSIDRGQLLRQSDWYITSLVYKNASNNTMRDTYKIILNKKEDGWQIVDSPQITPTKYNFPDVPSDVIKSAYNLTNDSL